MPALHEHKIFNLNNLKIQTNEAIYLLRTADCPRYQKFLVFESLTAADDKFCDRFPNFQKKL